MKTWKPLRERQKDYKNLVIIDLVNIAHRVRRTVKDGRDFFSKLEGLIREQANAYEAKKVILLTDRGQSTYRKEIYPEYKENRKKARMEKSPAEQRAQQEWFLKMKEGLEILRDSRKVFGYKGVEADDLVAYIVQEEDIIEEFDHIWLISSDGDWDILLSDKVSRYSFYTDREYTLDTMYDNCGVDTPEQLATLKALQGDRGDNIVGIDGVGVKRGYGVIREYGSALDIVDQIPLPGNQMFIKNINANADLIFMNYQLVDVKTFCYDAIAHAGALELFQKELKEFLND